MLVLSRKQSERIRLGNDIVVTVVRVSGDKVRLGIEAPVGHGRAARRAASDPGANHPADAGPAENGTALIAFCLAESRR